MRENETAGELDALGITESMERRRWETYARYYHLREARERDRDSRKPGKWVYWKGAFTPNFERHGRFYVRLLAQRTKLEATLETLDGAVRRGGAVDLKPDPEYRKFLKEWQEIQWAPEDQWCRENKESEVLGWSVNEKDVPLRAVLGGMQDFTHGVKMGRTAIGTPTSAS